MLRYTKKNQAYLGKVIIYNIINDKKKPWIFTISPKAAKSKQCFFPWFISIFPINLVKSHEYEYDNRSQFIK